MDKKSVAKFSKIYDTILMSTLWEEPPEVRLVFLGMVFASDHGGFLACRTMASLARTLNLTEDYVTRGLDVLTAPDVNSANQELEGRRIVKVDGGWLVVSKQGYVDKRSDWAVKKAEWRAKRGMTPAEKMEVDRQDTISGINKTCK